jgi:hypothetical protein
MTPTRLVLTAVALLSALATPLAMPVPAFAHGPSNTGEMPLTFAAGVRMLREERAGIDSSRVSGDFADLSLRAARLGALAGAVRSLAEAPPGAMAGPALEEVTRATNGLLAVSAELLDAAGRHDAGRVGQAASQMASLDSVLDAHVVRQYVCPMHCEAGRTYDRPGACPVCGMHLKLITDDRYTVQVVPSSTRIRAGVTTTLSFHLKDPSGFDVTNLEVVHEKLLHLIVVSNDLSWFEHVHPVADGPGRFRLRFKFPAGGTYTLFHDFTPAKVGMQVVPVELTVEGARRAPAQLVVDDEESKRIDGYDVRLTHTWLAPGLGCGFAFWLSRHGKPVTDLEPYLGAMGHLVIVSEDRATFIHSHPLEHSATADSIVQFGMMFAKTGRYKAWGQFQRHGRVLTVPFVVEVVGYGPEDTPQPSLTRTPGK